MESADVTDQETEFLYEDGQFYHFMKTDGTYDQIAITPETVGEVRNWLTPQVKCLITIWNDNPIQVIPPNFVDLRVVKTDPGIKGDTVQGGTKPAELETGISIAVPLFIENHDCLRIDTRSGDYISRSK